MYNKAELGKRQISSHSSVPTLQEAEMGVKAAVDGKIGRAASSKVPFPVCEQDVVQSSHFC